jgi:iron(III) transport system substrate-binding protein
MKISNQKTSPLLFSVCFTILFLCSTFAAFPIDKAFAQPQKDHTANLIKGAKKEGQILWYTTLYAPDVEVMLKSFRKKYPFIKPKYLRIGTQTLMNRVLGEARAKRFIWDVLSITGSEAEILNRKGLFAKYFSPERKFYPKGRMHPEGYWTDYYVNLQVIAYNTRLVSPEEVPKTWNDLLDPKWKGKMGMDNKDYDWFAYMMKLMGEKKCLEYMKKLGEQNLQIRGGKTLNSQLVAAGELSIGIALYNQRIERMKADGAPLEWFPMEGVLFPRIHPIAISSQAPHPNASKLFVDFILSEKAQKLIASFDRIPSRFGVDPLIPRLTQGKILPYDRTIVDDYDKYVKLYRKLLMKKR